MTETGAPLDEWIEALTRRHTALAPHPGVAGALGEAWMDRYYDGLDVRALTTAIGFLDEATRSGAGRTDDRPDWLHLLGVGHCELGRDYDAAIECFGAAAAGLDPSDGRYDVAVTDRAGALWARFQRERYRPGADPAAFGAMTAQLLVDLRAWPTSGADDEATCVVESLFGAALIERSEITGRLDDLDAGLAALDGHLTGVPGGHEERPLLHAILADGYRYRAELTDDPIAVERAIHVGWAALDEADDPVRGMAHATLAGAYEMRWNRTGRRADLDTMIGCWRALAERDPTGGSALTAVELLGVRFDRYGDPTDLAVALELATYATTRPAPHDPAGARRRAEDLRRRIQRIQSPAARPSSFFGESGSSRSGR